MIIPPQGETSRRAITQALAAGRILSKNDVLENGWEPLIQAVSPMVWATTGITHAEYTLLDEFSLCYVDIEAVGTVSGSASPTVQFELPFPSKYANAPFQVSVYDAGDLLGVALTALAGGKFVSVQKDNITNWVIGADKRFRVSGFYKTVRE